jgi:hypothetical protein
MAQTALQLLHIGRETAFSSSFLAFRANVDQTRQQNRALSNDLTRVLEPLADNGVEAIPFKGPVLALEA